MHVPVAGAAVTMATEEAAKTARNIMLSSVDLLPLSPIQKCRKSVLEITLFDLVDKYRKILEHDLCVENGRLLDVP